jgi:hypothetical protein
MAASVGPFNRGETPLAASDLARLENRSARSFDIIAKRW